MTNRFPLMVVSIFALLAAAGAVVHADDPPIDKGVTLRGTVVDSNGAAVSDAIVVAASGRAYIQIQNGGRVEVNEMPEPGADPEQAMVGLGFGESSRPCGVARAETNSKGTFRLRRLKAGTYTLLAAHPKRGWAILDEFIVPRKTEEPLQIKLTRGCRVYYTETESKLAEAADAETDAGEKELDGYSMAVAGIEPLTPISKNQHLTVYFSFWPEQTKRGMRLGPIPSGMRYRVSMSRHVPTDRKTSYVVRSWVVEGKPGERITLDQKPLGKGVIEGKLTELNGKPLAEVAVHLLFDEKNTLKLGAATDKDGRFRIVDVPQGKYRMAFLRHEPQPG